MKRPTSSYLIAVFAIIMAIIGSIQSLFFSNLDAGIKGIAIITLLVGVIFAYYVIPSVDLHEDRLIVVNPLTRHEIGLGAIEMVDTRFALSVTGSFGKVSAWAAPAPSRLRHRSHTREDFQALGLKDGQDVRPSDLPSTISGSYALQLRRLLEKPQSFSEYRKTPNYTGIFAIALPALFVIATQL